MATDPLWKQAQGLHSQTTYLKPNSLAMLTTAFLLQVIVYGLIAAVAVPAIELLLFVIRDGRIFGHSREAGGWSASASISWREAPQITRDGSTSYPSQWSGPLCPPDQNEFWVTDTRSPEITPYFSVEAVDSASLFYDASNGVIITPNVAARHKGRTSSPNRRPSSGGMWEHPHEEYWSYGNPYSYDLHA